MNFVPSLVPTSLSMYANILGIKGNYVQVTSACRQLNKLIRLACSNTLFN